MNKPVITAAIVALLGISGIAYAVVHSNNSKKAAEHSAMMKKEADAAMMKHDETMQKDASADKAQPDADVAMSKSGYITLADYNSNKSSYSNSNKVLFFHATWCPICQSIDKDATSNPSKIPAKAALIKADYDTETSLKQKYGVTQQYTFVQIDNDGNQLKKWSSTTLADAISQIQ